MSDKIYPAICEAIISGVRKRYFKADFYSDFSDVPQFIVDAIHSKDRSILKNVFIKTDGLYYLRDQLDENAMGKDVNVTFEPVGGNFVLVPTKNVKYHVLGGYKDLPFIDKEISWNPYLDRAVMVQPLGIDESELPDDHAGFRGQLENKGVFYYQREEKGSMMEVNVTSVTIADFLSMISIKIPETVRNDGKVVNIHKIARGIFNAHVGVIYDSGRHGYFGSWLSDSQFHFDEKLACDGNCEVSLSFANDLLNREHDDPRAIGQEMSYRGLIPITLFNGTIVRVYSKGHAVVRHQIFDSNGVITDFKVGVMNAAMLAKAVVCNVTQCFIGLSMNMTKGKKATNSVDALQAIFNGASEACLTNIKAEMADIIDLPVLTLMERYDPDGIDDWACCIAESVLKGLITDHEQYKYDKYLRACDFHGWEPKEFDPDMDLLSLGLADDQFDQETGLDLKHAEMFAWARISSKIKLKFEKNKNKVKNTMLGTVNTYPKIYDPKKHRGLVSSESDELLRFGSYKWHITDDGFRVPIIPFVISKNSGTSFVSLGNMNLWLHKYWGGMDFDDSGNIVWNDESMYWMRDFVPDSTTNSDLKIYPCGGWRYPSGLNSGLMLAVVNESKEELICYPNFQPRYVMDLVPLTDQRVGWKSEKMQAVDESKFVKSVENPLNMNSSELYRSIRPLDEDSDEQTGMGPQYNVQLLCIYLMLDHGSILIKRLNGMTMVQRYRYLSLCTKRMSTHPSHFIVDAVRKAFDFNSVTDEQISVHRIKKDDVKYIRGLMNILYDVAVVGGFDPSDWLDYLKGADPIGKNLFHVPLLGDIQVTPTDIAHSTAEVCDYICSARFPVAYSLQDKTPSARGIIRLPDFEAQFAWYEDPGFQAKNKIIKLIDVFVEQVNVKELEHRFEVALAAQRPWALEWTSFSNIREDMVENGTTVADFCSGVKASSVMAAKYPAVNSITALLTKLGIEMSEEIEKFQDHFKCTKREAEKMLPVCGGVAMNFVKDRRLKALIPIDNEDLIGNIGYVIALGCQFFDAYLDLYHSRIGQDVFHQLALFGATRRVQGAYAKLTCFSYMKDDQDKLVSGFPKYKKSVEYYKSHPTAVFSVSKWQVEAGNDFGSVTKGDRLIECVATFFDADAYKKQRGGYDLDARFGAFGKELYTEFLNGTLIQ